jgi:hypothetical protein
MYQVKALGAVFSPAFLSFIREPTTLVFFTHKLSRQCGDDPQHYDYNAAQSYYIYDLWQMADGRWQMANSDTATARRDTSNVIILPHHPQSQSE